LYSKLIYQMLPKLQTDESNIAWASTSRSWARQTLLFENVRLAGPIFLRLGFLFEIIHEL